MLAARLATLSLSLTPRLRPATSRHRDPRRPRLDRRHDDRRPDRHDDRRPDHDDRRPGSTPRLAWSQVTLRVRHDVRANGNLPGLRRRRFPESSNDNIVIYNNDV